MYENKLLKDFLNGKEIKLVDFLKYDFRYDWSLAHRAATVGLRTTAINVQRLLVANLGDEYFVLFSERIPEACA